MKKIIITLLIASTFIACDDTPTTGNVSKITNYPIITVQGDAIVFVEQGTPFVDPGVVAMEGSNEIPTTYTAVGKYRGGTTLDTNITDEYTLTYSATNVDGFTGSATRTVIVYKTGDLLTSIEGVYTSTVRRNGNLLPASQGSSVNMKYIYIWKNTDGTYEVSDAFGGWYSIGRAIGGSATPGGKIAGNIATNTFTFPGNPLSNPYFGGVANINSLTVDPVTKTLVLTTAWVAPGTPPTNYTFVSTLTQVQL